MYLFSNISLILPLSTLQRAPVWFLASAVSSCPLATASQPWLLCSACSGESASPPGMPWMCWLLSSTLLTRGRPIRHAQKSPWRCADRVSVVLSDVLDRVMNVALQWLVGLQERMTLWGEIIDSVGDVKHLNVFLLTASAACTSSVSTWMMVKLWI